MRTLEYHKCDLHEKYLYQKIYKELYEPKVMVVNMYVLNKP